MVVSGFGPYHRLCPYDAPAECADIIPIPWAMILTFGFGVNVLPRTKGIITCIKSL